MKHPMLIDTYYNGIGGSWYKFCSYLEPVHPSTQFASPSYVAPKELQAYRPSEVWLSLDYCCGSDYSGSALERSNFNYFAALSCNKIHCEDNGMASSFSVYIRGDLRNPSIIETLDALQGYPVIDDEDMSMLEMGWQIEYWADSFAQTELAEEVRDFFPYLDEVDSETLTELISWVNQQGNGWEWEYCGTGATLIHVEHALTQSKLTIEKLVELGVLFTLTEDWQEYMPRLDECKMYKALAVKGISSIKDENDTEITVPDWAYPNPNQLLLIQDK